MNEFLKNELSGWKSWEIAWLLIATVGITIISVAIGEDYLGLIAAVTGIICVILEGKGKLLTYFFAIIHVVSYAIIAYNVRYYGTVMLNVLYYLPMQFYGFYVWQKNMNPDTNEVYKKSLSRKNTLILLGLVFVMTMVYGLILQILNGNLPFVDALGTVVSVVGMYVSIKMYAEQWLLWIIVNIINLGLWVFAFLNGNGTVAILVMSIIYLVNSIIMYFKWKNEANG